MRAQPLFVVSTGRTGTTFLAHSLSELGADARHEPGPVRLQNASHARASGHLSDARAVRLLERHRPEILAGIDAPYVEASMHLYGLVDVILDHVPDSRVIQIVRDPRTYVRSAMIWGVHRLDGRPQNIVPFRRASPAHANPWNPATRLRWTLTGQFERVCWTWAAMNRTTRTQGNGHPRFQQVKFEDLFDEDRGPETLGTIAEAAALTPNNADLVTLVNTVVNPSSRKEGRKHPSRLTGYPSWDDWSDDQRETLRRHCEAEAKHYGYDLRS